MDGRSLLEDLFMYLIATGVGFPNGHDSADAKIASVLSVSSLPYTSNDADAQALIPTGWSWGTSDIGTPMCVRDSDGFKSLGDSDRSRGAEVFPGPWYSSTMTRCISAIGARLQEEFESEELTS